MADFRRALHTAIRPQDIHRRERDDDHLLRRIEQRLALESVRSELKPAIARPSVAPELMIWMLVIGY